MADQLKQLPFNGVEAQSDDQQRIDGLSDEALEKELTSQIENPTPEQQLEQPEQSTPEVKTDTTGQVEVKENQSEQVTDTPKEVVEPKPEQSAFDNPDLREKKGWKSPEDARKSYENLERALHEKAQKLAELRRQSTPVIAPPPVQPYQQPYEDTSNPYNDPQWREATARAFKEMNGLVIQPKMQELNSRLAKLDKIEREMTYERLSKSPDTADFVTPEIQEGLIKEYESHPEWLIDESARTKHLMDAYYMARGKLRDKAVNQALQSGQSIGAQSEAAKRHAAVETSSVASNASTKFDPMTSSIEDLDRVLSAQMRKEGRG